MAIRSDAYRKAEQELGLPPVPERGRTNMNPEGIGFWALVAEDFRTHKCRPFEQGFWAIFWHRFGNWRMGQPKLIRAPATLIYLIMFKLCEILGGISLWYTVKLGRRVRIWHHSGIVLGNRAIGDDCHIRQNTTIGVGQTGQNRDLPIVGKRVDIGAGACIAGAIAIGDDVKIGGNALVITDIPAGATVMGNPAQIVIAPQPRTETPGADASAAEAPPAPEETAAKAPPPAPAATRSPAAIAVADPEPEVPMVSPAVDMGTIALLGSANLDYLAMSFGEAGRRYGIQVETVVPEFGTARMELLAAPEESSLQQRMAGELTATLVVERAEDILGPVGDAPLSLAGEDRAAFLDQALEPMLQVIRGARQRLAGPVFVLSLAATRAPSLGLADTADARGRAALIAQANERLRDAIAGMADCHLLDAEAMLAEVGRAAATPGTHWHMGRLPFGEPFNAHLARRTLGALLALRGKTARILMLDLDNTLWGGVLGEDGPEGVAIGGAYPGSAYKEFQAALRALSGRGIALAVTSKNDEDLALSMIADHPEMVLRPEDFVAHRINWSEKALNIQDMLDEISLGAGSTMFIDDNPVEREKVRKNIPGCIVPEFPAAPEALADWLLTNPFLECLELTASDLKRSSQYKVRAEVNAARRDFENVEEFYRDLGMELTLEPFGAMNQQRALQLFVKTNQFNATTRRHDAQAVARILDEGGEIYAIGVRDRHSDYELMGVMVLREDAAMAAAWPDDPMVRAGRHPGAWWVDSFLLSCRILGRTLETAILAWATERLAARGATALIGQVIEAPRNTPVRGVFEKAGFRPLPVEAETGAGGLWIRDLEADGPLPVPDYFTVTTPADDTPFPRPEIKAPRPAADPGKAQAPAPAGEPAPPPAANGADRKNGAAHDAARGPDHRPDHRPGPAAGLDPATAERLDALFRRLFSVDPAMNLADASMDSVPAWDSLGHLKLSMEIERGLGIRLSGDDIGGIRTYPELAETVARRQ